MITKIAMAVLDIAKRESRDDQKMIFIKEIMKDLFLPCLQMIEELESQLSASKTPGNFRVDVDSQKKPDTKQFIAALEDRVQELNQANCFLETTLLSCKTELEEARVRLTDYGRLKAKDEQSAGTRG